MRVAFSKIGNWGEQKDVIDDGNQENGIAQHVQKLTLQM